MNKVRLFLMTIATVMFAVAAQAVTIDWVTVGDPDNDPDDTGYGTVDYNYNIGKFEITAGQYVEFLNAVAKADPYGVYQSVMANPYDYGHYWGSHVFQTGTSGSYVYTVADDYANRPMGGVNWANAARFCNWLGNGQPIAAEGTLTTETGSYTLNGATTNAQFVNIVREDDAEYVIPTLNEWYKAAYYDPEKPGGAGYWDYATRSDTIPGNNTNDTTGNNANYDINGTEAGYCIGDPYYRTPPGTFANSESPWGTFDQDGNVREWCEEWNSTAPESRRWVGGSYIGDEDPARMKSESFFSSNVATFSGYALGMRIAYLGSLTPVDVTWTGTANTTWSNTGNWNPGSTPDGVNVTFDDSATGTSADIASAATPASVTFNASQNFSITGASFGIGGAATVLKQGTGTVTMSSANSYTGLTTLENGKLVLAAGAKTPVLSNAGIDVKFGKLVLDYTDSGTSPIAVDTAMKASYAGGDWAGGKFQSSTATTANTLGWKADTVNKLITVEYTLYGDANVDGSVNLSDLGFLGDNYGATSGATWAMGDFNYDGRVNLSDLGFLGDQYGGHVAGFVTAGPANPAPEPGTLALLLSAAIGLLVFACRRRK